MKLLKENLFEAKLNLPQEYIDKVRGEAKETIGLSGPSRQEMQQMQQLLGQIFQIQKGHEDELTEIGKNIIQKFYGPILEGVELDVKIVDPDDEEKLEMAKKMLQKPSEEEEEQPEIEVELELPGIEKDIDKRKLINNIMQGEAQNVHDMMYDVREQVTEVTGNAELLDLYMQFLALNRKFDWDERVNLEAMMEQAPQMASAMETEWEGDEESGDDKPKIKARVLDLPMLIHETVKGIYELISAGAIDPDPVRAKKVLDATDTLTDEQEDIRYGPFIARDLRNYVNKVADGISGAYDIPNMREFVFGKIIIMQSEEFVDLITAILLEEDGPAKVITKFIKEILEEFKEHNRVKIPGEEEEEQTDLFSLHNFKEEIPPGVEEEPSEDNELINLMKEPQPPKKEKTPEDRRKKFIGMSKASLNLELNKAIDTEDWKIAQEIQEIIERKGGMKESVNELFINFPFKEEKFMEEGLPSGVEEESDFEEPEIEEPEIPNQTIGDVTDDLTTEVFMMLTDNGGLTFEEVEDLLNSYLFNELKEKGLTSEEIAEALFNEAQNFLKGDEDSF